MVIYSRLRISLLLKIIYSHVTDLTLFNEQILIADKGHSKSVLGFREKKDKVATLQIGSDLITKFNP